MKTLQDIQINRAVRLDKKLSRIKGDHCAKCGLSDLRVLQSTEIILCASCRMEYQGLIPVERHHLLGKKHSSFTLTLPANMHTILSFMGVDHPAICASNKDLKILYTWRDWLEIFYEIINTEITEIESAVNSSD